MSEEKKAKAQAGKAADMSQGLYLYVESIKEGAISVQDAKSGVRVDLFKGLNKLKKSDWEKVKDLPLMKSYLEAKTVMESKTRCLDPEAKHTPEAMDKAVADKKEREAEEMKAKDEAKAEEVKAADEAQAESSEEVSEQVEADEDAE